MTGRRWTGACGALVLGVAVAGCGGGEPVTEPAGASSAAAPVTYRSAAFAVPFDVAVPAWLPPEPSTDEEHFVTWESTSADRKVRVLAPVSVYRPGETAPTPVPGEYLDYLRSQTTAGAQFTDEVSVDVAGHPVTVLTATTDREIAGSLGCPADGMTAEDCFGLLPDLQLRIAVVPVDGGTVLVWSRSVLGDPESAAVSADLEAMVESLSFR